MSYLLKHTYFHLRNGKHQVVISPTLYNPILDPLTWWVSYLIYVSALPSVLVFLRHHPFPIIFCSSFLPSAGRQTKPNFCTLFLPKHTHVKGTPANVEGEGYWVSNEHLVYPWCTGWSICLTNECFKKCSTNILTRFGCSCYSLTSLHGVFERRDHQGRNLTSLSRRVNSQA